MIITSGSFSATDCTRDSEAQFAEIRQTVVDSVHRTLDSAKHAALFPSFLIEAIENQVWAHPRQLTHRVVPPMTLVELIKKPYPVGLGTSVDVIEKLIAGHESAMLAWEKESGRSCRSDTVTIPADLLARAQTLADAEGSAVADFVTRCVDDVVTWMEHAHTEIDAADVALADPPKRQPKYGSGSKTLAEMRKDDAKELMAFLSQPRPNPPRQAKPDRGTSVAEMNKAFVDKIQQRNG